jgi:hypothetical protein
MLHWIDSGPAIGPYLTNLYEIRNVDLRDFHGTFIDLIERLTETF